MSSIATPGSQLKGHQMRRLFSRLALVLSLAVLAAPASHASAVMCIRHGRCVIAPRPATRVHTLSARIRHVVPMRSDGSQHGR